MLETKAGTRARSEELFKAAIAEFTSLQEDLSKVEQVVEQASQELVASREQFAEWPLTERLYARILDVLGIKPIISPELSRRYKQAQDVKNHLNDLSNNAALDVCHFGGKLPGVHTLYTLSYDVLDNRFNVGFIIRTRANDETKFFYAQGDFDTLRYKTVQDRRATTIRIPRADSFPPVLYVPEGKERRLFITGYNGLGAYGRFLKTAEWMPVPNSLPTQIDPDGFVLK
ncbi:hypothetical protein A2964_01825 [Candidatus Daviesbacteria bacterium RIFCSPLOWO2_01_FULL_40_27]|nr:MAG: hypothetical protein A2964_01825 [Candidatus Daviesbacteria bacterium RIFCSPLOWO2_01_FULL_40_27]